MADQTKNNSQLLYMQAKYQFDLAKQKFDDGTIKTEPKLIQTVFQAFQEFFTSMGKPFMIPRYAEENGPPWSADFNDMMDEIKRDLELLFQEVDILGRALFTDFNHNMVQHGILENELMQVADKLRDLELLSTNMQSNGRIAFGRDDFVNKDKVDYDKIVGSPAHIENGAVTLKQKESINVAKDAQITIVVGNKTYNNFIIGSESNGFPGNNAEVSVSSGSTLTGSDYSCRFVGEKNTHGNYGAVLDGSPNTWFEYELVNVRDQDRQQVAKNLGFNYQVHGNQTLEWARDPEDGKLKLHMQLILKEALYINRVNVNMYTPPSYGARTAIVKNILITDGQNPPQSVMSANKKDDDYNFIFAPQKAKVISIIFEQANKYFTDVGHIYYEEKREVEDSTQYVFDALSKTHKPNYLPRTDGPLIALQDIGLQVKVDEKTVDAYYPLLGANDAAYSMDEVISNLTQGINHDNIDMGVEKFEGWRYCIGIRDIEVFSCEYEQESEIVSEPFYFDKPLEKITLDVSEDIPVHFYSEDPAVKYKYIKYFVSIDDGASWYPITPMGRQPYMNQGDQVAPKIYTIQQVQKSSQKLNDKPGYIESEYPVYSIRVRILLSRPKESEE